MMDNHDEEKAQRRQALIRERLQVLKPTRLDIQDKSQAHAGHAGAKDGGGHFKLTIASPTFDEQPLRACHQAIYVALDGLIPQEIHGLQIKILREDH